MFICRVVAEAACNGTRQILNQIAFPMMHFRNFPRYYRLKSFGGGAILKSLGSSFQSLEKKTREIKASLELLEKNSWNRSNNTISLEKKTREIKATTLSVWRKNSWNRSNTQGFWKNSWNRWIQKGIDPPCRKMMGWVTSYILHTMQCCELMTFRPKLAK